MEALVLVCVCELEAEGELLACVPQRMKLLEFGCRSG